MYQSSLILPDFEAEPARLSVLQLSLSHFRNYVDVRLSPGEDPVVLTGPNGSGKTNLLEAISLLVPGKGLRRAALAEIQRKESAEPWAVAAEMCLPHGPSKIGTGRDPDCAMDAPGSDRRVVMIDGRMAKNQQVLANHVAMTWITPDMDRVLADGASGRRKLLDRLVYSFDPAHAGRVSRYEKALRERLYLLRESNRDSAWFGALEDTLAQTGVAIAAARRQMVQELGMAMLETVGVFPQAYLTVDGFAENLLDDLPALLVEDKMRAALSASREEDRLNGSTAIGPHRSDLRVIHKDKNCPADLCSTGEQKALLIAIMLSYVRTLVAARQVVPLLLLDDITAHLDVIRREALFEEILNLRVQAWMTGTDTAIFSSFLKDAQHYAVTHGIVSA